MNDILALDISTTLIKAMLTEKKDDGSFFMKSLKTTANSSMKRGAVQNIEETGAAIAIAIEGLNIQSDETTKNAIISITGQDLRMISHTDAIYNDTEGSEFTKTHVNQLLKTIEKVTIAPDEEILRIIPQTYNVDQLPGVINPIGMSGRRLEVNCKIVVGKKSINQNLSKCLKKSGVSATQFVPASIASAEAVLTPDEKEAGVVLVDIGAGVTDIAIIHDNIYRHLSVIPFGGNVITNDIKEAFSILPRHAEQVKTKYGMSIASEAPEDKVISVPGISGRPPKEISFKSLAHVIEARLEEIIEAINYAIEQSGFYDKLSAGIVLTGGVSRLKDFENLIKINTGMEVRIANPVNIFNNTDSEKLLQPELSSLFGLLQNIEISEKIELEEEQIEEEELSADEAEEKPKKRGFFNRLIDKISDDDLQ